MTLVDGDRQRQRVDSRPSSCNTAYAAVLHNKGIVRTEYHRADCQAEVSITTIQRRFIAAAAHTQEGLPS